MLRLSSQTQQSRVRAQLELLLRNAEPGERLPSEPALAKRFDVSRTTIREVMSQLEIEGFVQRRQGSGTYVRRQPLLEDESLLHFVDFPTLISKQGHTPAMRQLGFVQQRAGAFFSNWLMTSRIVVRLELSFPPVFTSMKKIGSSPGAACTRQMNIFVYWLKTVSRWPSSRKVSVYSCLGQTIPICGFSFFAQPAAPPVRTKPQSPLPNRKTTRSLNPCSRTSSIRCSF